MNKPRKTYSLPGADFLLRMGKYAPDTKYASFNRRMLAATADSLLAMIVLAPVVDFLLRTYYPLPSVDWQAVRALIPPEAADDEANRALALYLLQSGYIGHALNHFLFQCMSLAVASGICWRLWSATPGKMLLRMKVVDAKTEAPLSDNQIIMRLMGYAVSALPLCAGFFWIGVNKRRQGWHDMLAGSVVVVAPRRGRKNAKPATEAAAASDSQAPSAAE